MTDFSDLSEQMQAAQRRLESMQRQASAKGADNPLLIEAIAELSISLEELHIVTEELYEQNEILAAARQEIEIERQRYQNLFDFAPDAYLVTDLSGVIQVANSAAEVLFGVRRDFLVAKPLIVFIAEADHPLILNLLKDIEPFTTPSQGGVSSPSRASLGFQNREVILKSREQEEIPCHVSFSLDYDRNGQIIGIYWLFHDLRRYKKVQEDLATSRQLLQTIVDNSPAAIYLLDLENRHLLVNRAYADLLSTAAEDLLGKSIHEVWPKGIADVFVSNNRKVLETGQMLQLEVVIPQSDGLHTYITVKFPLRDAQGIPYALCGIATDITEKKQLEQRFYHAQRLESLGTLASGIAHDLNNVFTPILGVVQLLPRKFPNLDPLTQELLELLENNVHKGVEMVKQILLFARRDGRNHVSLQLAHLLPQVVQIAQRTLPKEIEFCINIPEQDLGLVSGDVTQLHQVFMNLIVNAADAMPSGGILTIRAVNFQVDEAYAQMNPDAHPGAYVGVTVADTGMGIAPEYQERIFDPFFTTKEVGKGTGLGLATVLGITKNHGGFIHWSSKVGQGSQFTVYLPATLSSLQSPESPDKLPKGKGELVLVADDEAMVRKIAKSSLETYNYRVLESRDGIEAMALYVQNKTEIKVILMDLLMPNLDGITAIRSLLKINPEVKIIATSGLSTKREQVLEAGARLFLQKPYTIPDLLGALSTLCGNRV